MEQKTIINSNGEIIDRSVNFINLTAQDFEMKDNYKAVNYYDGNFVKPHWNGSIWEETATQEELNQAYPSIETTTQPTIADLQVQIFNLTSQLISGGVL
jgi:hypothetical protein